MNIKILMGISSYFLSTLPKSLCFPIVFPKRKISNSNFF